METETPLQKAMLKDLELQWRDHHHMRDQTWKTLASTIGLLLAVVGIALKSPGNLVMIPAYAVIILSAYIGWAVSTHHRLRQQQKFEMIKLYERELGLLALKDNIIKSADVRAGIAGKIFTGNFIGSAQLGVGLIAATLLAKSLWPGA